MVSKAFSISFTPGPRAMVAMVLLGWSGSPSLCQVQPASPAQAQAIIPATVHDPTQAEVQPRLDLDHDPIPSPDAE